MSYKTTLTIKVPKSTDWQPAQVEQLMANWFTLGHVFSLIIRATHEGLEWQIQAPDRFKNTFTNSLHALYPQAEITESTPVSFHRGYHLFQLESSTPFIGPFSYASECKVDPLSMVTAAIGSATQGEEIIYELMVCPPTQDYGKLGETFLTGSLINWKHFLTTGGAARAMQAYVSGTAQADKFAGDITKMARKKLLAPVVEAKLMLKIKSKDKLRSLEILDVIFPSFTVFSRPGMADLVPGQNISFPLVLSAAEVGALWHLPTKDCTSPRILWQRGASAPAPQAAVVDQNIPLHNAVVLGENRFQGAGGNVIIGDEDRAMHVNLIGGTGVGKSTLMLNMIKQDIAQGKGVAVIDPNADLVTSVMQTCIDEGRMGDVILFDVMDTEFPIGMNLLRPIKGVRLDVVAGEVLSVIRKMFAESWSPTRMEDVMYASLAALINYGQATIRDIPRLLLNEGYRREVLAKLEDQTAIDYWLDEFEPRSEAMKLEIAGPINTRIRQFYRNPQMRRIFCQERSINFRHVIDRKKIFLANLAGIPDIERDVLGALLISKLQLAFMSRVNQERETRLPYYVYIDEVQNFVTSSLPTMLSEARKYGLRLTIANQFLYQLKGDTLAAVMGNVGTTVFFRMGQEDARVLSPYVKPQFTAEQLLNLDPYQTIVRMTFAGRTEAPFSIMTRARPPITPYAEKVIHHIRSASRSRFGKPAAEVDESLQRVYAVPDIPTRDEDDSFAG